MVTHFDTSLEVWALEFGIGVGANVIPVIRFEKKGVAMKKKKKKKGGRGRLGYQVDLERNGLRGRRQRRKRDGGGWDANVGVGVGADIIPITRSGKKGVARKKKKKKKGGWGRKGLRRRSSRRKRDGGGWDFNVCAVVKRWRWCRRISGYSICKERGCKEEEEEEEERGMREVGMSMWALELGLGVGTDVIAVLDLEIKGLRGKRIRKGDWEGWDVNVGIGVRRYHWCRRNSGYLIWKERGCKEEEERGMGEVEISMSALELGIGVGAGVFVVTLPRKKGVARKKTKKKEGWGRSCEEEEEEEERGMGEVGISMWALELGVGMGADVILVTRSEKKGVARKMKKKKKKRVRGRKERGCVEEEEEERWMGEVEISMSALGLGVGVGADVFVVTRSGKNGVAWKKTKKKEGWGRLGCQCGRWRWCRRNSDCSIRKERGCEEEEEEEESGIGEVGISMWALELGVGIVTSVILVTRSGKKRAAKKKQKKKEGWGRLGFQCGLRGRRRRTKGDEGGGDINVGVGVRRWRCYRRNFGYSILKERGCEEEAEEERGIGEVGISMCALELSVGVGAGVFSVTRSVKKGVARKKKKKKKKKGGWERLGCQCGRWS
ncbi:hypothetical protein Droror1_Dr00017584 [Drosera rotundifolia]